MSEDKLSTYRNKRSVERSGEPSGGQAEDDKLSFVVQRHDASSLHFDFRLQVGDVLASWAVPKGPSLDPRQKRLATRTEDHPLDYAGFEGTIPQGEYGAGTVIVWDTGSYVNHTEDHGKRVDVADALDNGHLRFELQGSKLSGDFALTQTKMGGDDRNWLLVKIDDAEADRRRNPTSTQNESVQTGRTNQDLQD
jgi:DNA ligase D-like protein (predicted 3'-phosphoesterase)